MVVLMKWEQELMIWKVPLVNLCHKLELMRMRVARDKRPWRISSQIICIHLLIYSFNIFFSVNFDQSADQHRNTVPSVRNASTCVPHTQDTIYSEGFIGNETLVYMFHSAVPSLVHVCSNSTTWCVLRVFLCWK